MFGYRWAYVFIYAGIPVYDQEEMFTATWFTSEQILAQEVPGGLVFDPFRRSVEEYLDQLSPTLDDFDESKHKRDEKRTLLQLWRLCIIEK